MKTKLNEIKPILNMGYNSNEESVDYDEIDKDHKELHDLERNIDKL